MPLVRVSLSALDTLQSGLRAAEVSTDVHGQAGTVERKISSVTETVDICHEVKNSSWVVSLAKAPAEQDDRPAASEAC